MPESLKFPVWGIALTILLYCLFCILGISGGYFFYNRAHLVQEEKTKSDTLAVPKYFEEHRRIDYNSELKVIKGIVI